MTSVENLVTVVTTDLAAITRGRAIPAARLEKSAATGVGWVPANLSLTPFNSLADPNPWGSSGDLRLVADMSARFHTQATGAATPFDIVMGDLVELDGQPWVGCTRTLLKQAVADLKAATGLTMVATFEQELRIFDAGFAPAHAFSIGAMRRADPFCPRLMAALGEAGVEPEMVIAEYGSEQFEIIYAPADPVAAADRAVAAREITRELARCCGWRASFAPKTGLAEVGNGVHIHFSFADAQGRPVTFDGARPGGLSEIAGSFCAGVLRHLQGITVLTASSVPSYFRLKPHNWSSSYTWLGDRDREASLRICPTVTIGGRDPAWQYNIEYRVADATANPYLLLAAIIRAGLQGIGAKAATPPLVSGDPSVMDEAERKALGLYRLPETLPAALDAFLADKEVTGWFDPRLVDTFVGIKRHEIAHLAQMDDEAICDLYGKII
jgi:glutamine synthetase